MKIILHIGTEKTGTTTIQGFLHDNRALLQSAGILVPYSLGEYNHRLLPGMASADEYVDELFRQSNLLSQEKRAAAKASWAEGFATEVRASACSLCVVSSEHLQSRLLTLDDLARLRKILAPLFSEIEILLYIRKPIATAVSLYSTSVKFGSTAETVPNPDSSYFRWIVNHRATIELWQDVFGEDALKVRIFERAAFVGNDLVQDFIHACGLPALAYADAPQLNESLSHLGLEIMRRVNVLIPTVMADGTINPLRHGLPEFFERHFSNGPQLVPSSQTIEAYETAFAGSDEWVRARFFPERENLFSAYVPPDAHPSFFSAEEYDRIAKAIVDLWGGDTEGRKRYI